MSTTATTNGMGSLYRRKQRLADGTISALPTWWINSITTSDVRRYITKRQADVIVTGKGDHQKTRHVSNAEINRELTTLKRMFSLALEAGKLLHRPHVPMLREDNIRTGFFERDQFEAVRAHLPAYLQPLVTFM